MRVLRLVGLVLMLVDSTRTHSAFSCEPVLVNWCRNMPYNSTFFPNLLGHYDQDIAAEEMKHFTPLIRLSCSPDVDLFLCRTFFPECGENQSILKPCKQACERVLRNCSEEIRTFGITWPPQLQCEKLQPCDSDAVAPNETSLHNPAATRNLGFWCPLPLKTRPGKGSTFLGAPDCAPPCAHMFLTVREVQLAKTFIGVCSVLCLCATLFTVLTFLIDVKRFRYPERPIVFYAVCYSFVSLAYLLGFLLGDWVACAEPALPGGESTVVLGSHNRGCSLLFMMLYFFSSAGMAWWVVLTFTWFLAAGPKWSCEAIEQKAVWFHGVAWGLPGVLTVLLLALSKPEGDVLSGVCFVGLHDLMTLRWFVVAPALLAVTAGVSLLLAGIICLSRVRQVIQHDQQNRRKLKKFMIRIGVFSALYLLPLLLLLGCRLHELSHRHSWENSWIARHCQHYSIPCSHQDGGVDRPALSLFLLKYLVTLVVGIPAVFWVSSKKTCAEWSAFLNRTRKKDPISESRRVLQESCNFFLQHNSRKQHKQSSSSHQLKVLSKSMGTSTGPDATIRAATDRGSE